VSGQRYQEGVRTEIPRCQDRDTKKVSGQRYQEGVLCPDTFLVSLSLHHLGICPDTLVSLSYQDGVRTEISRRCQDRDTKKVSGQRYQEGVRTEIPRRFQDRDTKKVSGQRYQGVRTTPSWYLCPDTFLVSLS
jgi:hypothetical protein